jgi:hypothetical protein
MLLSQLLSQLEVSLLEVHQHQPSTSLLGHPAVLHFSLVQEQHQHLEVRPQDRACSALALGLLPHGPEPAGCDDRGELDSFKWVGLFKSEK